MTRYAIQMTKPGAILNGQGLIEKVVANTGTKAEVIVYVTNANRTEFEKLLAEQPEVKTYYQTATDLEGKLTESRKQCQR